MRLVLYIVEPLFIYLVSLFANLPKSILTELLLHYSQISNKHLILKYGGYQREALY